jgi:uncharacterized protein YdeI (YjbR/CyaY-like superfamily)
MALKQVEDAYNNLTQADRYARQPQLGKESRDESRMERIERKLDEILQLLVGGEA